MRKLLRSRRIRPRLRGICSRQRRLPVIASRRLAMTRSDPGNLFQRPEPVIHVPVDLILGEAVALLQLAFELLAATLDHVEIVVGELAPFFLGEALELLPVAFN